MALWISCLELLQHLILRDLQQGVYFLSSLFQQARIKRIYSV